MIIHTRIHIHIQGWTNASHNTNTNNLLDKLLSLPILSVRILFIIPNKILSDTIEYTIEVSESFWHGDVILSGIFM